MKIAVLKTQNNELRNQFDGTFQVTPMKNQYLCLLVIIVKSVCMAGSSNVNVYMA
jgi:hypothetical protein